MTSPIASRVLLGSAIFIFAPFVQARLGETEAQSQARYGEPTPELIGPQEKPVLPGAKEVIHSYQGWRLRVAFVNDAAVRIEYVHLPENNAPKKISEDEVKAVLEAEKGKFAWREEKARTGYKELNALKTILEGRQWERSDHARAVLKAELLLVVESRDAADLEKKLNKASGKATPGAAPGVPKF